MSSTLPRFPKDPETLRQYVDEATRLLGKPLREHLEVEGRLIQLPAEGEAIVLGDLHGDIESLLKVFKETGFLRRVEAEDPITLICLGDYVDRGPSQVEVIYTLLRLMLDHPGRVILLRGNHEGPEDIDFSPRDFPQVLRRRFGNEGESLLEPFQGLFDRLLTAVRVDGKALLLHGGIPTGATDLGDIAYAHEHHPGKSYLSEMLWNDPSPVPGLSPSHRGVGNLFGADIASGFLERVGCEMLIRGHQSCEWGFRFSDGPVLTLFSCKLPQYRNKKGAYLQIPLDGGFSVEEVRGHIRQF